MARRNFGHLATVTNEGNLLDTQAGLGAGGPKLMSATGGISGSTATCLAALRAARGTSGSIPIAESLGTISPNKSRVLW